MITMKLSVLHSRVAKRCRNNFYKILSIKNIQGYDSENSENKNIDKEKYSWR